MIDIRNFMEQELQNNIFDHVIRRNDNHHPLHVLQERNHRIEFESNNNDINHTNPNYRRRRQANHTNFDNHLINGLTRRYDHDVQRQMEYASARNNIHHLVSIQNNNNNDEHQQRTTMRRITIQNIVPSFNSNHNTIDDQNFENVPRGISQMEIEQRTHSFIIKEKETLSQENQVCAICQMDFEKDDPVRQLSLICTHIFHKDCIDRWMKEQQPTCPVCRKNIIDMDI